MNILNLVISIVKNIDLAITWVKCIPVLLKKFLHEYCVSEFSKNNSLSLS